MKHFFVYIVGSLWLLVVNNNQLRLDLTTQTQTKQLPQLKNLSTLPSKFFFGKRVFLETWHSLNPTVAKLGARSHFNHSWIRNFQENPKWKLRLSQRRKEKQVNFSETPNWVGDDSAKTLRAYVSYKKLYE